jgi:adenine nucleotide transporter 17
VANLRIVTSDSNKQNNNNDNDNGSDPNLWKEMQLIVQTEGWTQLWSGTWASLLLVSNPVIQFFAYEQLKNSLLQLRHKQGLRGTALKPLDAFLMGALAKAISTVLTYPLQLTQTVLRVQKQAQESQSQTIISSSSQPSSTTDTTTMKYKNTFDCLRKIYRRQGLEGWFSGMQTKLLQTVLTAAFTFLTYEQIIKALVNVQRAVESNHMGSTPRSTSSNSPVP